MLSAMLWTLLGLLLAIGGMDGLTRLIPTTPDFDDEDEDFSGE